MLKFNNNQILNLTKTYITEIMTDNELDTSVILNIDTNFIHDLMFKSLMLAQLIMLIQEDLDVEPFMDDFSIVDVKTIGDFVNVYSISLSDNKESVSCL
ncbi:hypothetical protein HC723_16355 [Vibrio sp. S11_S32]|uniref:phosphopantetheine-binding protein n=1 Tax=Vibrio sp. S11_S32 TaxID=2720225 RepID=UPI0016802921|nr:phosphopantetheine-binding protein [Vibrio sp. S11_S32]MBD1577963.1 hypothetical protein [Vibrio sp. S11_S32]